MTKTLTTTCLITTSLAFSVGPVQALDCTTVATILGAPDVLGYVHITSTTPGETEFAKPNRRDLCAGDQIEISPKATTPIKVLYYSESQKTVEIKGGEKLEIQALNDPCGLWCKAQEKIQKLLKPLLSQEGLSGEEAGVFGKAINKNIHVAMPLAAGEGPDYPLYLFAQPGPIQLLWRGGEPPYQLEIKDDQQKVVFHKLGLESTLIDWPVSEVTPGQTYHLSLISKNAKKIYQKTIIFSVPPLPLDPKADKFTFLATLLQDPNKNWRVEIWRQLLTLPPSPERERFLGHLWKDDFTVQ
jgi:hypothetical protein